MTLLTTSNQLLKAGSLGVALLASTLLSSPGIAQDRPQLTKGRPGYGPQTHEFRARMIMDPITSGDEKDFYEIRRAGYEAWRRMENPYAFKAQATDAWRMVTKSGSQGGVTSGRARSIAFHPTDPKVVYLATAQGGIWKTNDVFAEPAAEWTSLSSKLPTLAMGAIAVDPKNPDIIFAGTGEYNGGYSTPNGQGLFRSKDGGLNWELVSKVTDEAGYTCAQIVIDPNDSKNIYVATGSNKGLIVSRDGGDTWTKAPTISGNPVSIAMDMQNPDRIMVSTSNAKIFRTTNKGAAWTACTLPGVTSAMRTQVAVSPSSPDFVYATVLKNGATEIHKSEDFGATWVRTNNADVDPQTNPGSPNVNFLWEPVQGNYASALVVDPTNHKRFVAGGLFIVHSTDFGANLRRRSNQHATGSQYVHADNQFLAYNQQKVLFALSDGGITFSRDHGQTWKNTANAGLGTLQFVGVDADKDFTFVVGGTQDNGTNKALIAANSWDEIRGGDGGAVQIAEDNPRIFYGTSVNGDRRSTIFKTTNGGASFLLSPDGSGGSDNMACNPAINMEFYPRYDISADGSVIAVAGNKTIFVSTEGAMDCIGIAGVTAAGKDIGSTFSIHISRPASYMMWAGKSKKILWSEDIGATWNEVALPGIAGAVSGITSDAQDPMKVYAVSSGASGVGKNFARSTDGGKTWTYPATALPAIPAWSIATAGDKLFMGTDFGVLYSDDEGATWYPLGQGMPLVQVLSLKVRGTSNQYLLAGTYGRGAYYIDISNLPTGAKSVDANDVVRTIALEASYPNPVTAAVSEVSIDFNLQNAGEAQLTLHDMMGREIRTIANDHFSAGKHTVTLSTTGLEAGTYFYALTSDGQFISDKLVVNK